MAEEKRDYYEVLGVGRDASDSDIKSAYRRLAKKYHPDMNPGDKEAEQKFKEVNEAYAVLSDPEKKQKYDQFGHAAFDPSMGGGEGGGFGGFGGFGGGGFDFGDIFSSFFGGGGGGGSRSYAEPGEDILVRLTISFTEALFGCKKEVSYNRIEDCDRCKGTGSADGTTETCATCHGTGRVTVRQRTMLGMMQSERPCADCGGRGKKVKNPCPNCKGKGRVRVSHKIEATIPAGIDDGQRIAFRAEGNAGRGGAPAGDLIIEIRVRRHELFERRGPDLYCSIPISFTEAALGAEIDVPLPDGRTKRYTIPEGTQPGATFRLRGEGAPDVGNSRRRGDIVFTVTVEVPRNLTAEQKELLRSFASACGDAEQAKRENIFKKIYNRAKEARDKDK